MGNNKWIHVKQAVHTHTHTHTHTPHTHTCTYSLTGIAILHTLNTSLYYKNYIWENQFLSIVD